MPTWKNKRSADFKPNPSLSLSSPFNFNFLLRNCPNFQADNLIKEMEKQCDERISKHKEEAQQYLLRVKEEHGAMVRSENNNVR